MWFGGAVNVAEWVEAQKTSSLYYRCDVCDVFGKAESEDTLTCWYCGRDDNLTRAVMPTIKDDYAGTINPASYSDDLEEVDRLLAA